PKTALEFKSTSLTVPALLLASNDLSVIEECLREKIAQGAEFFRDSPVLIDLHRVNAAELEVDVAGLVSLLFDCNLVPISLRGGTDTQNAAAVVLGLSLQAVSPSARKAPSVQEKAESAAKEAAEALAENRGEAV